MSVATKMSLVALTVSVGLWAACVISRRLGYNLHYPATLNTFNTPNTHPPISCTLVSNPFNRQPREINTLGTTLQQVRYLGTSGGVPCPYRLFVLTVCLSRVTRAPGTLSLFGTLRIGHVFP
jgi:ABC-type nickel/cobalt efflux system permease component RcnA